MDLVAVGEVVYTVSPTCHMRTHPCDPDTRTQLAGEAGFAAEGVRERLADTGAHARVRAMVRL